LFIPTEVWRAERVELIVPSTVTARLSSSKSGVGAANTAVLKVRIRREGVVANFILKDLGVKNKVLGEYA
jgi:hypothetical protein